MKTDKIELVNYTKGEEALNVITHLAGLVLPVLIIINCLPLSEGNIFYCICAVLYAVGTAMTFGASAVYHILPHGNAKKVMRVIDHTAIFFAVAGTVTGCVPAVFSKGSHFAAVLMLVICWGSVIAGTIMTVFFFGKLINICMAIYILSPASCAIIGSGTFKNLPSGATVCIISGGIVLLIGCVLYRLGKKIKYVHSVFHVFIVLGLGIYYYGILNFVFKLL